MKKLGMKVDRVYWNLKPAMPLKQPLKMVKGN